MIERPTSSRAVVAGLRMVGLAAICLGSGARAADTPPQDGTRAPVFFQSWSAALDAPAQKAIAHVAKGVQAGEGGQVWVIGYADLTGSEAANRLLSQTRAQVVTDQLLQDGVPANRIHQSGLGSTGVALHAQESRRVMLVVSSH